MSPTAKGYLYIAFAGTLFGMSGVFNTGLTMLEVPPAMIAFTSQLFATICMFIYIVARGELKSLRVSKHALFNLLMLGIFAKGFFKLTYETTIATVGMSTGTILLYVSPIFSAIITRLFFKERLSGIQRFALLLNLLGCMMVVTEGDFTDMGISRFGIRMGIASAFFYSLTGILGKKLSNLNTHPRTSSFYMMLFATIFLIPFSEPWQHAAEFRDGVFLVITLLYALIPTLLANTFYLTGLNFPIKPTSANIVVSVEVVVASIIGVVAFHEPMALVGYIGCCVMLLSIILMNSVRKPKLADRENTL